MLFLISSAPDTKEFRTSYRLAMDMGADVCLLQDAVYASRDLKNENIYVMVDDMKLRGISESEIRGRPVDYDQLIDLMVGADKVIGIF
jgi:sulfur relay protein TusB/DsrH